MAKSLQRKLYELYRNGTLTRNDIDRLVIIPNNASNGQMVQTMFPVGDFPYSPNSAKILYQCKTLGFQMEFSKEWWMEEFVRMYPSEYNGGH